MYRPRRRSGQAGYAAAAIIAVNLEVAGARANVNAATLRGRGWGAAVSRAAWDQPQRPRRS